MRGSRTGFTLIEVLAAITVLMIIGSILANVFHQATIAWESGLRSVEMSAEGRSAIDLMALEISQAVVPPDHLIWNIPVGSDIEFYTASEPDTNAVPQRLRSLRRIRFYKDGGGNLRRVETALGSDLSDLPGGSRDDIVLADVGTLNFWPPSFGPFTTELPEWIDVTLSLSRGSSNSVAVTTSSYGRDRNPGGGDDLEN